MPHDYMLQHKISDVSSSGEILTMYIQNSQQKLRKLWGRDALKFTAENSEQHVIFLCTRCFYEQCPETDKLPTAKLY
jgi:hypothetical protein